MGDRDVTPDQADALLEALARIPDIRAAVERLALSEPTPQSTAYTDSATPFGACALMYAMQSLQVAVDHLLSWRELFATAHFLPSFAQMTLLRTAIDSAARARWLVDDGLAATERAYRGALSQLESAVELRRFVETDPDNGMLAKIVRRERSLSRLMRRHGHDPHGGINSTAIADSHGIGAWSWRYTSGYAHAREWAITSTFDGEAIQGVRKGQRRIQAAASALTSIDLTTLSVGLAIKAHNDVMHYMGRTADQ